METEKKEEEETSTTCCVHDARAQTEFIAPGKFRYLALPGRPEFWMTETVRRSVVVVVVVGSRCNATDDLVRLLFRRAKLGVDAVVVSPRAARSILRRPHVSDKYVYHAFRRDFVADIASETESDAKK